MDYSIIDTLYEIYMNEDLGYAEVIFTDYLKKSQKDANNIKAILQQYIQEQTKNISNYYASNKDENNKVKNIVKETTLAFETFIEPVSSFILYNFYDYYDLEEMKYNHTLQHKVLTANDLFSINMDLMEEAVKENASFYLDEFKNVKAIIEYVKKNKLLEKLYSDGSWKAMNFSDLIESLYDKAKDKSVFEVPAKITHPAVSTESLKSTLLADKLGTFSSDFSSSSADRAHNIELACSKIDGYVLSPGEEFSYNEVVGPRTAAHGFRVANVYVGNTVQPGIGGGICQVSSTMFNAVVYADLEITERRNHTLPVSYVPMGRDATVSYGATDFKFKNNYDTPIQVRAECIGRKNVITIYGTARNDNREIKIETAKTGTSSPKVTQKKDDTLPVGTVKVEEAGTNGSSYIAYKVVYENGVEIARDVLCRSVYAGKDRVELIGTMEVPEQTEEPTDPPATDAPAQPSDSTEPSAAPDATDVPAV